MENLDSLREITVNLIENHVKLAGELDDLGPKMPLELVQNFKKHDAIAALPDIAKKLKYAVKKKSGNNISSEQMPLVQPLQTIFSREDVDTIQQAQETIHKQFKAVHTTLDKQNIEISTLRCQIEIMKADVDSKFTAAQTDFDNKLAAKLADFDNKLAAKLADFDDKLEATLADVDSKLEAKQADFDSKLEAKQADFDNKIATLTDAFKVTLKASVKEAVAEAMQQPLNQIAALTMQNEQLKQEIETIKQEKSASDSHLSGNPRFFS